MRVAPVEFTARYATSVDGLGAAWAFVMGRIDQVGPDPMVTITPRWVCSASGLDETSEGQRTFEVVVSGMIEVEL